MTKSINREIIEELALLTKRAQQIACHQYDQLELDESLPVHQQAYLCFVIAVQERKEAIASQQTTPSKI